MDVYRKEPDPAGLPVEGACEYCGGALHPAVYFCPFCAMPYKSPESVLSAHLPLRPGIGTLVDTHAPQVKTLFWTYFTVLIVTAIVCYILLERTGDMTASLVVQSLAMLATTVYFAARYWRCLAPQFGAGTWLKGAGVAAALLLIPLLGVNWAWHNFLIQIMGADRDWAAEAMGPVGVPTWALVLLYCVSPAVLEEVSFRGLLQHWLRPAIGGRRAILVAAGLFTVLHFSILSAPYLFAVGCLLGWAKLRTGGLWWPMLIHFLHNLIVVVLFP